MERYIDIKGGVNIRDLGGYVTQDGGVIKWRNIFRAGILTHIQEDGLIDAKALNIQTICDFRADDEQAVSPDKWYNIEGLNRFSLPVGEGRPDKFKWLKEANLEEGKGHHLYKANKSYVETFAIRYKRFFEILMDDSNYPLLFHCTAGKDRTGFATMLLLHALGVQWNTIIEDYLLTNKYLRAFAESVSGNISKQMGLEQEKVMSIFQARESYLQGALDVITKDYGSIDVFLEKEMGIGEREKSELKKLLLEN